MKKTVRISLGLALVLIIFLLPVKHAHAQWNPNVAQNILISDSNVAVMQSSATSDGKMWCAYYTQVGSGYEMWAQLIDADGHKLLGSNGVLVDNQPSGSATYVFNICVDPANNLIVAMQDSRSGSLAAVVYKISQAGTHLWSSNGIVLGTGLAPYPAVLSTGEVIVAWNATTGSTLNLHKITVNGTLAWPNPKAILIGTTKTTAGQPVGTSNGGYTMVYQKKGVSISTTLYVQKFDSSGSALYAATQISNQTSQSTKYYTLLADGDTIYAGYSVSLSSRFNAFLQKINPDGTLPWGINGSNFCTAVTSADPYQMNATIARTPGSPIIWAVSSFCNSAQSNYGIYVQKFNKTTGARLLTDGAKNVYPITAARDQQIGNLIAINNTPMFMIYTDPNYKIYATRLDSVGNFAWPYDRVTISSTTATAGTPKGRYAFNASGPSKCAGFWNEDRGTGKKMGYAQGVTIDGLVGINVATEGNVPAEITTAGGTLQVVDTIFPVAANQAATWSIVPVTGNATISLTGLVTAKMNGTVWAKATAVADASLKDSVLITITGQNPIVCNPPSGVTIDSITLSSAKVFWVQAEPAPSEGYEYEVRTSGEPGSGPDGLAVSGFTFETFVHVSGLNAYTQYHVYVRSGCALNFYSAWSIEAIFTTLPYPIAVMADVTAVLCHGLETGAITTTVTGGVPPFTYLWNNGATTSSLNGIAAGNYELTVTDGISAPFTGSWTVNEPAALSLSVSSMPSVCAAAANGSASVSVSGGTTPYSYLWSNGGTTSAIANLAAGSYTVTVFDANNCGPLVASVTITDVSPVCDITLIGPYSGTGCFNANIITTAGGSTLFIVGSTANIKLLASLKIRMLPGTKILLGGNLVGKIVTDGQFCSSFKLTEVGAGVEDTPTVIERGRFSVSPNPTSGSFTVAQKGDHTFGNVRVEVFTINGEKVVNTSMIGEKQHEFDLSGMATGLYFVKVVADDYVEMIKLVKTR